MAQEQREHERNPGGGTQTPGRQGEQGTERKTDQTNREQGRREEGTPRPPQSTE